MAIIRSFFICLLNILSNIEFTIFQEIGYNISIFRKLHLKLLKIDFVESSFRIGKEIYIKNRGNLKFGANAQIGSFSKFWNYSNINIGDNFLSAGSLTINTGSHDTDTLKGYSKSVKIGNNVWCGVNVTILAGVTIGNNVIIGACSLVNKDIPDNSIAVGNPARVIKAIEITN